MAQDIDDALKTVGAYFGELGEVGSPEEAGPTPFIPDSFVDIHKAGEGELPRPPIVVLCGSTRFMKVFHQANYTESLAGRIVLTVAGDTEEYAQLSQEAKAIVDELHLRKIDLADEVLVLNLGGYIGESTRREVEYAKAHGKKIRYWALGGG
jgi:hypothetical protein